MATELKLLIANCSVVLFETVHLLPRVDLAHGDFGRAKLRIERLANAVLVIGGGFLLLLLCHLRLVFLAIRFSQPLGAKPGRLGPPSQPDHQVLAQRQGIARQSG